MEQFTLTSCLCLAVAALLYTIWKCFLVEKQSSSELVQDQQKPLSQDFYGDIEPLNNFEWRTTARRKIWKLKPRYFLTMALETLSTISDLVAMDESYLERITLRKTTLQTQPREATHDVLPEGEDAVLELYTWLTTTYLPNRFPTVYVLSPDHKCLDNRATGDQIPLIPDSALTALKLLGENVDNEFLLLKPKSLLDDGTPAYHLQAFITLSPSGFDLRKKIGLSISDIHKPVPSYKERLEKSMNRFFAKLECGKAVLRTNWSVTRHSDLFVLAGNHLYAAEEGATPEQEAELEKERKAVIAKNCRLRCERQTLHRLPKTKALVFSFKTYLYTLDEVKAEGKETAELLAQAIDGLAEGNAPGMAYYKGSVIWKDAVQEYLRK